MSKPLVIITGASSGIGAATAKLFSEAGHPLLLLARRLPEMEALALPNALCRAVDVMDVDAFRAAIAEAEARFGKADCLVNNAGVMFCGDPVKQSADEWQRMLDVNLRGLLNGIQLVLEGMVARQSGTIVNIGSIAGVKTFPKHAVYCGTKFAVHAITETIRQEVSGSDVRLVTIAPGMVETDLVNHSTDAEARDGWWEYANRIGGALKPESIAQSILFAYQMPQSVCVREMVVCPTRQEP
ncbi:MAG: SDR family oxidoreductase [Verrucomicrobiae bacterium]|nr:SDR family oxidoreductase [Verrucomicrobiae bacterium]MCP5539112.1 SDR family oxidoreductase [Akkermansiaceae bacterium]MCP5549763.1 SDR family oxidoreductase [Akkermansiaceae bacterium]